MSPARPKPKKPANAKKRAPGKGAPGRGKRPAAKKRPPAQKKPRAPQRAATAPAPAENPHAKAMAQAVAQQLLEKKALDVVILDVRGKTSYADYVVIASGDSERQVTAMAENVLEKQREQGERPLGAEGLETGNWVLLDFGEVVAHLFFTEVRSFYDLEGLWADAPKEKVA